MVHLSQTICCDLTTIRFPSSSLFREEVIQAQSGQWIGKIRIGRPLSFGLVTAVALACAVALVSDATWRELTRSASVPGVLLPEGGPMYRSSPQIATVAEALVNEGDTVQAGQALIRLRAERMLAGGELGQLQTETVAERGNSLDADMRLAEQQAQKRRNALQGRRSSLHTNVVNFQGELGAVRQRESIAQKNRGLSWNLRNFPGLHSPQMERLNAFPNPLCRQA